MNVRDALISIYCENPCQVLPNALWKTAAQLEQLETSIQVENHIVTQFRAWRGNNLLMCWTRDREYPQDLFHQQNDSDFALVHQDYLHAFPSEQFTVGTPYFRLICRQIAAEVKKSIPTGFSIVEVKNIRQESVQIGHLIAQCYPDIHPGIETIISWSRHPTFDPSLWVWVFDNEKSIPVGLGIAEIDHTILEGSLEWIQVLPAYRGLGLGRLIVKELLSRLETWVKFTTVAGEVNNKTNPESLYRNCGFEGSDIWWMFRK